MTDYCYCVLPQRLLLPLLVVLTGFAQDAQGFSHSKIMSRHLLNLDTATQHDGRTITRRRLVGRTSEASSASSAAAPFFWATIDRVSFSSFTNDDDDEDNYDDEEEELFDVDGALNGMDIIDTSAPAIAVTPTPQLSNNNNHNRRQPSWNNNNHQNNHNKKKRKKVNPAMGDPVFLRKRTEKLLALPDMDEEDSSSTGSPGDHHHPAISSRGMKVNRNTFHFLIDAWAFSGEMDAAEQAIALLHKMEDLAYSGSTTSVRPDVRSYTKVINAIARSATSRAGEMAEEILEKMNYLYHSGENVAVKPNTYTYTAVVEAHAHSGAPGSAQQAEEICELMVQKHIEEQDPDVMPTARCYNAAINAYAKTGDAVRADDLFRRMEGVYLATGLQQVKPNSYNYNSLISAWANCGEEGAAQRAEEVLERMEQAYKEGDEEIKPTTVTYNAVIDAYSKVVAGGQHSDIGGEHADDAGERAESILRHMEELSQSGENVDAKPNTRSYNSVINVWAKSQSLHGAKRAEEILDLMEKLVQQGDTSVAPDVHSFSTVINAWARSQKENKAERALNLLKEMKQLYKEGDESLRPNVVVANAVMNACAYTSGDAPERNRAMEIAHKVLKDLELGEYGKPDQVTYGTFLQVCANQMPECSTREKIVGMIFQKCSRDGQVGELVLQQLRMIASPEMYRELVGFDAYSEHGMEDLPNELWCNVVEGKWRRRRNF